MALEGWRVEPVENSLALELVVKNHYLHRRGPCTSAFGLFSPDDELSGVVTYGVPASVPLVKGVLGPENRQMVGELTRLWVDDGAPKFGESFLIGNSVKRSGFRCLVSFADTAQGHRGIVYQATNWLYTGLSSKHKDWELIDSPGRHTRHTWDEWGGIEGAKLAIPERMRQVERPRKHRYVLLNGSKSDKRWLRANLRYPVLPYPA